MAERTEQNSRPGQQIRGKRGTRAAAVVILAGAAVILFDAIGIAAEGGIGPQQPGFFPMIVGIGLVVFGLAFLATTTLWPDRELLERAGEEHDGVQWATVWLSIAGLVAYSFLLTPLGYIIATCLFILALTWVAGSRKWVQNVAVALIFPVVVYFGFTELLGVRLPAGLLGALL